VTAFEEGSSLDRIIFLLLIGLAVWILTKRQLNWGELFKRNPALLLFLAFALASVLWSDYPFVTFKRWIRDLGLYAMALVVLSDPRPQMAVSTVIRRFTAIVLFLSLVLIKYYPQMGIQYGPFNGLPEYVGATTSKNMLGVICLISGLFYFWDTLGRWSQRKVREDRRILILNVILFAITLRLLMLSNSATSRGCLVMGCLIIVMVRSNWAKANPRLVTASIPAVLIGYFLLQYVFDLSTVVAGIMGRDPTLHGRTGIWDAVLAVQTRPLIGFGYQNFWMGYRLTAVWSRLGTDFLNEAHNGYLEMYLNLGLVGLILLVMFMVSTCRTICRQLSVSPHYASFGVALWMITVFYNFTEAAFGASPLWIVLLLCAIVVPRSDEVLTGSGRFALKRGTAPGLKSYANRSANGRVQPLRNRSTRIGRSIL
jgi:O-antigen ligase